MTRRITASASQLSASTDGVWAAIPKRDGSLFGIKCSRLRLLAVPCKANGFKPKVRSVSLKERKNQKQGTRLIHVPSLLTYLDEQADLQATEAAKKAAELTDSKS